MASPTRRPNAAPEDEKSDTDVWEDNAHPEESLSYNKVQFKKFCPPVKTSCPHPRPKKLMKHSRDFEKAKNSIQFLFIETYTSR